jgi:putative spermidine/putrescine transport system substrate-binding protein
MTRHTRLPLAVAAVALATALAACGARGGTTPQAGEQPTEQDPSATYELEDTLVFAGAGAGLGEAWKAILDDFAAEHGVSYEYVEGSVGDNQSKVEAQIRSGTVDVDVVMSNENVAAIARAQGLTTELDYDRLPNVEALGPMGQPGDFAGPVAAVSVLGIAYSPSYFAQQGWEPPTSWADVMDPQYAECLIAPHPEGGGQRLTIALMNRTFGSGYEDIDATLEKFGAIVDRVPTATSHVTEGLDFVSQGIGCLTVGAQGRVLEAKAAGGDIEFVIPEEGTAAQGLPLYIVPDAPHPNLAYEFIDFALGEQAQRHLLDAFWSPTLPGVTADAGSPAAEVTLPDEFDELGIEFIPASVFENTDTWIRGFDALLAR